MSSITELGSRIKTAIGESVYKAKEVAVRMNISPQAISKAIKNNSMRKSNLRKMAEITGCDVDWLIHGKEEDADEFDTELMAKCITAIETAVEDLQMTGLNKEKVTRAALMLYDANRK